MAPEVLLGQPFDEKTDVYSFGLILVLFEFSQNFPSQPIFFFLQWFLLTGREPFDEFTELSDFVPAITKNNVRPLVPLDCPPL
jgi:serine/threonine protein kinase